MTNVVERILIDAAPDRAAVPEHFACLPVAALLLAENGSVVAANAAAHRLLDSAPGALAGRSAAMLFPGLWSGSTRNSIEFQESDPPRRVIARRADGCALSPSRRDCGTGRSGSPSQRSPAVHGSSTGASTL